MATIRGSKKRKKQRCRARRVRIGAPDPRLTRDGGVEAVRELDRVLAITDTLDAHLGALKTRRRGLSGGELLLAVASAQLTGADHLVGLDRRRADAAGQELEPVPMPASTTAAGIARRFTGRHLVAVEEAMGAVNTVWVSRLPPTRRAILCGSRRSMVTPLMWRSTGAPSRARPHAYTGALTLRPHIGFWAEAGVPLAGELMGGAEDPRANCVDLLDRSIAALPDGVEQIRCRWDAGYFAADLAKACLERGVEFAIGAKRTRPLVAAAQRVPDHAWVPAVGMEDTEVTKPRHICTLTPRLTSSEFSSSSSKQRRCFTRRTRQVVFRPTWARGSVSFSAASPTPVSASFTTISGPMRHLGSLRCFTRWVQRLPRSHDAALPYSRKERPTWCSSRPSFGRPRT